jgi:hypothetical protein
MTDFPLLPTTLLNFAVEKIFHVQMCASLFILFRSKLETLNVNIILSTKFPPKNINPRIWRNSKTAEIIRLNQENQVTSAKAEPSA